MGHDKEISSADHYREYWAYLRHLESTRFSVVAVMVTGTGIVIALYRDSLSPASLGWGVAFVSGLFALTALFLTRQKKSYEHYFGILKENGAEPPSFGVLGPFPAVLLLLAWPQVAMLLLAISGDGWPAAARLVTALLSLRHLVGTGINIASPSTADLRRRTQAP